MVSFVADPHESEAMCATNKREESNWYLSEIGLLLATLAAIIIIIIMIIIMNNNNSLLIRKLTTKSSLQ